MWHQLHISVYGRWLVLAMPLPAGLLPRGSSERPCTNIPQSLPEQHQMECPTLVSALEFSFATSTYDIPTMHSCNRTPSDQGSHCKSYGKTSCNFPTYFWEGAPRRRATSLQSASSLMPLPTEVLKTVHLAAPHNMQDAFPRALEVESARQGAAH
ncbi:hypothetical protein PR048_015703 [Dryococelus australis]|uniref:Uncharacterized protein n=1 Tax=Dryococelus australis TaxID=614101 RepID=A0ABQ9HHQ0_9NEOP|nr:hypothetical protein PR048_015703 [Dryococelus australis]